ncbi:MAG: septum site-determining protein MinC [Gammaproteobacteria bacterium]
MSLSPNKRPGEEQTPFELKGSLFTLTVMHLRQTDVAAIDQHLAGKIAQAPDFFNNAPTVIDLEALADKNVPIDFTRLYDAIRKRGLIPVGVRNGSAEMHAMAALAGLPTLPEARLPSMAATKPDKIDKPAKIAAEPATPKPQSHNRIHVQTVRSGQQLYAANGDLIVLGSVSPGAELLADGNIHVYGVLRGRALAGIKGDQEARIFCQALAAEILSIAGNYRVIEQLDDNVRGKPAQVYLAQERLMIEPLLR